MGRATRGKAGRSHLPGAGQHSRERGFEPLYTGLPPGRSTMSRAHVAAHQRARLRGAAVAALSEKSAAEVTVADLISLAGVSRRAFYEHFDSKQACLLSSYEDMLGAAAQRIMGAYAAEPEPLAGVSAAYEAFVNELVEQPLAARVVIVDVLALGRVVVQRGEPLRLAFEAKMREDGSLLGGLSFDPVVLTAVLAGVWQLARRRLLEHRVAELHDLRCELLAWVAAYSSPAVDSLQARPPVQTQQGLSPTLKISGSDPNRRILLATAQLVARDGYRDLSPAAVIDTAGVTYDDFFDRFQTVEQCFLAAIELISSESLAHVWTRARTATDWIGATRLAIDAFLAHMAAEPAFAPIAFVEVFALGNPALALRERFLQSIEALYARHADGPNPPSTLTVEAVVGALWGLVYDKALRGETDRLPELSEHAAYIVLAPVLGAEPAVARIRADRDAADFDNDDPVKQ